MKSQGNVRYRACEKVVHISSVDLSDERKGKLLGRIIFEDSFWEDVKSIRRRRRSLTNVAEKERERNREI